MHESAGHSVAVLYRFYAKILKGAPAQAAENNGGMTVKAAGPDEAAPRLFTQVSVRARYK
ncbi:hypothetical protein ACSCB1_44005 [Streptomyces europaeiscabiei]|uniref:hypothetical protein n=1 Tax=Streptomyces europaeiscabiei TaxID=146819 RepID=UPI0006284516|nr:hypothetical protein [Streptomyces europaeiscabiei]